LLDEPDGVLRAVKGDGAEMLGAAPDSDVHLSCDQHPLAGFFEEGDGLFAGHGGEILQKIVESIAAFDVINHRSCGNARDGEAWRAAHDFQVNHHHGLCFHGRKLTQPNPDRQGHLLFFGACFFE